MDSEEAISQTDWRLWADRLGTLAGIIGGVLPLITFGRRSLFILLMIVSIGDYCLRSPRTRSLTQNKRMLLSISLIAGTVAVLWTPLRTRRWEVALEVKSARFRHLK